MKRIILSLAIVACSSFAFQAISAVNIPSVTQEVVKSQFQKIDVKDLPVAVVEAIQKAQPESTIKAASVSGTETKTYQVIVVTKDQKELTLTFNEKGEPVL